MVLDEEQLFRALKKNIPNYWKKEFSEITSAVFKDSNGVSVDRDGERSLDEIKQSFRSRFPSADFACTIEVTVGMCRDLQCDVIASAEEDNPHHALIYKDAVKRTKLSRKQARRLAKLAVLHPFT